MTNHAMSESEDTLHNSEQNVAFKVPDKYTFERVAYVAAAWFLSCYLSGPLPYVRRHITVNKMCWVRR